MAVLIIYILYNALSTFGLGWGS